MIGYLNSIFNFFSPSLTRHERFFFSFFFSLLEILFLGFSTAVRVYYLLYLFDQIVPVNLVALFVGDGQGESVVALAISSNSSSSSIIKYAVLLLLLDLQT